MTEKNRETFSSRLGFILVAVGCAVGLGNVWKFPYLCGQNGGAAFILIYLLCLAFLALPILVCELSVGRASRKSSAKSFDALKPGGTHWHLSGYMCMAGTYLLMMFYTCVCGWMFYYFILYMGGSLGGSVLPPEQIGDQFGDMLNSPLLMTMSTFFVIIMAFGICSLGVRKGVENVTKWMMIGLFVLIVVLAVHSLMLPGSDKGVAFYLVPDFGAVVENGIGKVVFAAMSQAFFTLSIGIGAMSIFGSYLDRSRSLMSEGVIITVLDTLVALFAGLTIIPACFAYHIEPGAGPSLVFITMPTVFEHMMGGRIWGGLFFLFLAVAALSTVVAVFENIIAYAMDLWGWSRRKAVIVNLLSMCVLSIPCVLGFNVLSGLQPMGAGSSILDLEDFLVSYNFLPLGAIVYLLFCVSKNGWGWDNFINEANAGKGMRFPAILRSFMTWGSPLLIVVIYLKGYYDTFAPKGTGYLVLWMFLAILFLCMVGFIAFKGTRKQENRESA